MDRSAIWQKSVLVIVKPKKDRPRSSRAGCITFVDTSPAAILARLKISAGTAQPAAMPHRASRLHLIGKRTQRCWVQRSPPPCRGSVHDAHRNRWLPVSHDGDLRLDLLPHRPQPRRPRAAPSDPAEVGERLRPHGEAEGKLRLPRVKVTGYTLADGGCGAACPYKLRTSA